MPSPDLHLAARRVVEFESIRSKLHDAERSALTDIDRCVRAYQRTYSGRRELRRDLNESEWSVYQYTSLLHMLSEMVERTNEEFDIRLQEYSPVRYELSKLIGLRHCIHHNGLVGMNIAEVEPIQDPVVVVPLPSIRAHGSWGGGNPDFQTFFHDVSGTSLALKPILRNSESPRNGIIAEMLDQLETQFGENELRDATTDVTLYD